MQLSRRLACATATTALVMAGTATATVAAPAATTVAATATVATFAATATVPVTATIAAPAPPGAAEPVTVISLTDTGGERTAVAEDGLQELADAASGKSAASGSGVAARATSATSATSATFTTAALTSPSAASDAAAASFAGDIAVLTAPIATEEFLVAGLTWDAGQRLPFGASIFVRVQEDGEWSDWLEAEPEEAQDGGAEGAAGTDPFVTGGAEAIQVQVSGDAAKLPSGLALNLIPANPAPPEEVLTETPRVAEDRPVGAATAPTEPTELAGYFGGYFGGEANRSVQSVAATATASVADVVAAAVTTADLPVTDVPTTDGPATYVPATTVPATYVPATGVTSIGVTVPRPAITSRSGWGAEEKFMSWQPRYVPLKATIVHHTAGTNNYTPEESASIVRGIYYFHAETRDWGDIGYNFLVDKWGRIFEGRTGSLAAPPGQMPVGAHAAGFNTGTMGISAMGDYTKVAPPRAIFNSMANVIAWQFARAGIDLNSASGIISPGTAARPKGQNLPRIFGHRDVGNTSCPGAIADWLPELLGVVDSQALQLYYLNNSFGPVADVQFRYGANGSETFVGDWDGDGVDTIATREGNRFYVTNQNSYGSADAVFAYGKPGDVILVGDWNGDGKDTFAVRRGKEYHVRNTLSGGPAEQIIAYGFASDQVLVGDWNGNGQDTFAVRRGHVYYVKNSIAGGPADQVVGYGRAADEVLVGDWDGDGQDTFAVKRESRYFVKNAISAGNADFELVYGRPTDLILVGDWDGDGRDTFGVMRP